MYFHYILFLVFINFIIGGLSDTPELKWKDFTYLPSTQSYYKLHNTSLSWNDANKTCSDEDSYLFYPESLYELNKVKEWWGGCESGPCLQSGFIHVGYEDVGNRGVFTTIDGIPVDDVYNVWYPGEPNNRDYNDQNKEDCMELYTGELLLNDIVCDSTNSRTMHPFICKKKLAGINGQNRVFWKDYKYIEFSQSFYKLYIKKVSWMDANQTCNSDGASLFYPESTHEVKLLKEWWELCQSGPKCLNNDYVHMAYTDLKQKGHFVTVDGVDVNQVFHNWQPNEPNLQPGEDCVELSGRNLNLNDIPCEGDSDRVKHSFICKKKLSSVSWNPETNKINIRFDAGLFNNLTDANSPGQITDTSPPTDSKAITSSISYIFIVTCLFIVNNY